MLLFTWNTCLDIVQQQTILFRGGEVYGPVKFSILLAFAARTCVSARLKSLSCDFERRTCTNTACLGGLLMLQPGYLRLALLTHRLCSGGD